MAEEFCEIRQWSIQDKLEDMAYAFKSLSNLTKSPEDCQPTGEPRFEGLFGHIYDELMGLCELQLAHRLKMEDVNRLAEIIDDLGMLSNPGEYMDLGLDNNFGLYSLMTFFSMSLKEIMRDLKASQGPDHGEPEEAPEAAPESAQEEEGAEA